MSEKKVGMIRCPICKSETFLMTKPRFEGFQKVGVIAYCSSCGHEFDEEERPPLLEERKGPKNVLGKRDPDPLPQIFGSKEDVQFCMYCQEYVEHPFTQRCMKHQREVKATDTCPDFKRKNESDLT